MSSSASPASCGRQARLSQSTPCTSTSGGPSPARSERQLEPVDLDRRHSPYGGARWAPMRTGPTGPRRRPGRATSSSSSSTASATTPGSRPRRRRSRSSGPVERRWSYATWTAPSHYNLLMGLLPHTSPPEVYASEYYKQDFRRYSRAARGRGDRVQAGAAVDLHADLPAAHARLPHRGAGLDAGAQPAHGDQPRLRRLRADADPQRHGGDAAAARARRRAAVVLAPERRRDPLPVRAPRRGPVASGRGSRASTASSRRLDDEAEPSRPSRASSSTRRGCASCTTARSTPSATSTA